MALYPAGGSHPNWAGFSLDLKIIDVHSGLHEGGDSRFYNSISQGAPYSGTFAGPLDEIASIFDLYD